MRNVFSSARPTLLLRLTGLLLLAAPVFSACDSKTSLAKQTEKAINQQKEADDAAIQAYLTRHSINGSSYTRTADGLYLINVKEGPASEPLITVGKKVTTVYVGKFIGESTDGLEFDNSSNNRTACGCFSFTAGAGGVIQGWEKAVLMMRKGDRKLLLVPSYLAYGATGSGKSIGPNTPLLFDMEITDVK